MRKVIPQKVAPGRRGKPVRAKGAPAAPGSRAGLERERLVAAALALLREAGIAALSTRRIAARLGVQSAALYWHVRNKRELLGRVADAICAEIALPGPGLPFRARLERIAGEYRRVLLAHRDAPRLFAEHPPLGPHRMRLYDTAVGAFLDAGFAAAEAAALATFYRNYLLGMIAEEARHAQAGSGAPTPAAALGRELAALGDAARDYPNLRRVADRLAGSGFEETFRLGLSLLLDGIERRAAGRAAAAGAASRAGAVTDPPRKGSGSAARRRRA